jgi:hypothetical protein
MNAHKFELLVLLIFGSGGLRARMRSRPLRPNMLALAMGIAFAAKGGRGGAAR